MSSRKMSKGLLIENVIFVGLEEQYSLEEFSFRHLRGKDRDLAFLLQNCRFLDVHLLGGLTRVKIHVLLQETECPGCDNSESACQRCVKAAANTKTIRNSYQDIRWIDTNDVFRQNMWPCFQSPSNNRQQTDRSFLVE